MRYWQIGRIQFLRGISVLFLMFCIEVTAAAGLEREDIRIGLTPVILTNKTSFFRDWKRYLEGRLEQPVRFIQRHTYREVVELLLNGDVDVAWLCGYPYVQHRDKLELLSVPVFKGKSTYHSYLIVPASDHWTKDLLDLRGKVFAYSDPDSNSGYLQPQVELIGQGINPRYFFTKAFFAWSHRDVVKAVVDGVAQGGAVDSYVWETLKLHEPELVERTRIVWKSRPFGFPPLVTRRDLPVDKAARLRAAFLNMKENRLGMALLEQLNLDEFVTGDASAYDGIAEAAKILEAAVDNR